MKSTGKLVVVTGGTKGIGRAVLEVFAEKGFNVATYSRNESDLQSLKTDITDRYKVHCEVMKVDGGIREEVERFGNYLIGLDYDLSVLVNNTGTFVPGTVLDEEEGAITRMIETNVYSAYFLTRILGREMRGKKSGHIFNICSTASIMAYPNGGSYCISKHALLGFSRVLREELKEYQVRVTTVLPGATMTASWEGVELPDSRLMKSEDVAASILSAYELSSHSVMEEILLRPQLGDL